MLTDDGQTVDCKIKGNFRLKGIRSTNPVAVGDRVNILINNQGTAFINEIDDRRNYIVRKSPNLSKQSHIIAANVDLAVLIATVDHPVTSTTFIDRFLASAEAYRVPALLVLVIHQTLFLGIGILFGTTREDRRTMRVIPPHLRNEGRPRVVMGRALAYMCMYLPVVAVDLVLMPRLFGLPHIGSLGTLSLFLLPFMLATTFFCMTVCSYVRERDTGIVTCIFFSVVLLFLSGAVWPACNMPSFWRCFSYLFPSTHGIQGYIRINTMGATLEQVKFEYLMLWLQTALYFATSCLCLRIAKKFKIG